MGVRTRVAHWLRRSAQVSDLPQIEALRVELADLERRVDLAMGALQVATDQLAAVRTSAEGAQNAAQQALQRATSALATAEAAVDGVMGVEDQVARLMERTGGTA